VIFCIRLALLPSHYLQLNVAPPVWAKQAEQSGAGYLVSSWQLAVCIFDRSKAKQLIRQEN